MFTGRVREEVGNGTEKSLVGEPCRRGWAGWLCDSRAESPNPSETKQRWSGAQAPRHHLCLPA